MTANIMGWPSHVFYHYLSTNLRFTRYIKTHYRRKLALNCVAVVGFVLFWKVTPDVVASVQPNLTTESPAAAVLLPVWKTIPPRTVQHLDICNSAGEKANSREMLSITEMTNGWVLASFPRQSKLWLGKLIHFDWRGNAAPLWSVLSETVIVTNICLKTRRSFFPPFYFCFRSVKKPT